MYQTTPDEPSQVVNKLGHKHSTEAILLGRFTLSDRTVSQTSTLVCVCVCACDKLGILECIIEIIKSSITSLLNLFLLVCFLNL